MVQLNTIERCVGKMCSLVAIVESSIICGLVFAALMGILSVGGFVADHVMGRSKLINRFIANLPMSWM